MLILEYQEIEVDYCAACKGVWLDEGELEQMLGGTDAIASAWDTSGDRKGERRCPRCGEKMRLRKVPGTDVEIDMCPASCGIWLDRGEIVAVAGASLPEGPAAVVGAHLMELFGNDK